MHGQVGPHKCGRRRGGALTNFVVQVTKPLGRETFEGDESLRTWSSLCSVISFHWPHK